ncbi:hypothetical protein FRC00_009899, partial [Tulasnella sp. 408]
MDSEAPSSTEGIVFYGTNGSEAERFVQSITKMAHEAGKYRDNDWIIERVEVALAGDALRWYIELDPEIQNDWKLLRKAIMQQYPSPTQRTFPEMNRTGSTNLRELSTIPTPAAAPPLAPEAPTRPSQKLFNIRLLYGNAATSYFLGLYQGELVVTSKKDEAVIVLYNSKINELRVTTGASALADIPARR